MEALQNTEKCAQSRGDNIQCKVIFRLIKMSRKFVPFFFWCTSRKPGTRSHFGTRSDMGMISDNGIGIRNNIFTLRAYP